MLVLTRVRCYVSTMPLPTATPDASRARPVEPFYAAVLASPARLENSTRAAPGVPTGLALYHALQETFDQWKADIARSNAGTGPLPESRRVSSHWDGEQMVSDDTPPPVRKRRRAPVYAPA